MSYIRCNVEADKELELIENNPTMKNFLTANHSSYGNMINAAMKSFVTKNQRLSSTDIRGKLDPRPRVLMENPNAFALLFKYKYKYENKNPRAKFNNCIGRKDYFHTKKQFFPEKAEREKRKLEEGKKKEGGDDAGVDFDDNDNPIYRDSEGNIIPVFKTPENGTVNNLLEGAFDLNNFWNSWDKNANQSETQPPLDVSEGEQSETENSPYRMMKEKKLTLL